MRLVIEEVPLMLVAGQSFEHTGQDWGSTTAGGYAVKVTLSYGTWLFYSETIPKCI